VTEKEERDAEIVVTTMKGGRGVGAGNTVTVPETDIGTETGRGIGVVTGRGRDPTAAEGAIAITAKGTAKTVTETEGASVMILRSLTAKSAQRGGRQMRMLRMVLREIVLAQLTKTVLRTEGQEVGLLSIHETNSMIHPDIEGIGITVVERVDIQLEMMMKTRNALLKRRARYLLLGMSSLKFL
jgi:hypothetical protein